MSMLSTEAVIVSPRMEVSPPVSPPASSILAERIRTDTCFKCQKQGHWAKDCPSKTPNKCPNNDTNLPVIQCPHGHGSCSVLTSSSEKNPNRKYYECPRKRTGGCDFFKWYDEMILPAFIPVCSCGAGRCCVDRVKVGPDAGRWFFTCRVQKGHGACKFLQWEDARTTGNNCGVANTVNDVLGSFEPPPKRMRVESSVMDNNHQSPNLLSTPPGPSAAVELPPTGSRSQKLQSVARSLDFSAVNEITLDVETGPNILYEAHHASRLSEVVICPQQLSGKVSGAEDALIIGGPIILGLHASRLSEADRSRDFSALNEITQDVETGSIILGHHGSRISEVVICPQQPSEKVSVAEDVETDPIILGHHGSHISEVVICPQQLSGNVSVAEDAFIGGNQSNSVNHNESSGEEHVVKSLQNSILSILEFKSSQDRVSLEQLVNPMLNVLDGLTVDNKSFREHVGEFIRCASTLAQFEQAIGGKPTLQDVVDQYNHEKDRVNDISRKHSGALDALNASNGEARRLKDMIIQIENQLSCCETETLKLKTRVDELCEEKIKCERSLQTAEEALRVARKKEEELVAAKESFEKAKKQLQQH